MSESSRSQFAVTRGNVARLSDELAKTASHPEFLRMVESVRSARVSERRSVAKRVARVEEVTSRAIPVPETFRLTTRTFEDPEALLPQDSVAGSPTVAFDGQVGSVSSQGVHVSVMRGQLTPQQPLSSDVVMAEIKEGVEAIGRFITSPAFQSMLTELAGLEASDRPQYVVDELLNPERRAMRGLAVPDGMHIQRSEFADDRPTLFCVSKIIPSAYPWHKVTITFDNA